MRRFLLSKNSRKTDIPKKGVGEKEYELTLLRGRSIFFRSPLRLVPFDHDAGLVLVPDITNIFLRRKKNAPAQISLP